MVPIYRDIGSSIEVGIDFYKKTAVLELNNGDYLTHITINGEFLDGDKNDANNLIKWLGEIWEALEAIIWEWETGNDDFNLIEKKLNL